MSSRSVAAAMGLHRQAIQRIERRAMAKVRRLGLSAFASALPDEGD
jgi:DNA-directed RNA polymerase sigma subunit (sigma70/sigma32)